MKRCVYSHSSHRIWQTKYGLNPKLHARCDDNGKPLVLCLSECQLSDHVAANLIYPEGPNAKVLVGDKGYDSDGSAMR